VNLLIRIWDVIYSGIQHFNNFFNFIGAVLIILAALYIFSSKYIKMLLGVLQPLGFRFWPIFIFRVLFLCRTNSRNSAATNIRKFCEFMILRSEGQNKSKSWWQRQFQNFAVKFKDSDFHVYEIDNLSEISCEEELETAIDTYFSFLYENRKKLNLNINHCNSFELLINIKYGLLSTNFLISGLLKTYKEDWNILIDKYIQTVNRDGKHSSLYTAELSSVFVWLLWGPSYELVDEQLRGGYKIAQYSFGDESNSFHLIIPTPDKLDDSENLWSSISSTPNGIVYEMTCKLHLASDYVDYNREYFSSENTYFLDKITKENVFLLEAHKSKKAKGYIADRYYCTAYVWIIFFSGDDDSDVYDPDKHDIVAFFEHTNQVDKNSFDICVKALMAKTFAFFDEILSNRDHGRKYRYLLSMSHHIALAFSAMFTEKSSGDDFLSKRYVEYLEPGTHNQAKDIFENLDNYFSDTSDNIKLVEVDYSKNETLALFGEYYTSIHIHESPRVAKKTSLDAMLNVAKGNKEQHPIYHVVVSKDGEVVAGVICDYKSKNNHIILRSLLVKEEYRSSDPEILEKIKLEVKKILRKKGYIFIDKRQVNSILKG